MITPQKNIAVFCGSSGGRGEQYLAVAREMGRALAGRGYGTVYGGAQVGMMGALADAALAANGQVIGVIPHVLEKVEITHRGLTELHIVPNMHERKALIASRSDAFIALPGGIKPILGCELYICKNEDHRDLAGEYNHMLVPLAPALVGASHPGMALREVR